MSITDNSPPVQVNAEDMARDLLAFLQLVEEGETLVIMKTGKPVAELRPIFSSPTSLRPFGLCAGEFTVPDDFDDPINDDEWDEAEWLRTAVHNPAFDSLNDPAEDIYSLTDGEPFHDEV